MGFKYGVIGAGRQGIAAAYDIASRGNADEVVVADIDEQAARRGAARVNRLFGRDVAQGVRGDASKAESLATALAGARALVSSVHYAVNPALTRLAIRLTASMCDLGGNTRIALEQRVHDADAKAAGVSIVPDCGMGPGLNITLAADGRVTRGATPVELVDPKAVVDEFRRRGFTIGEKILTGG